LIFAKLGAKLKYNLKFPKCSGTGFGYCSFLTERAAGEGQMAASKYD
jgi:hypothetical protein